MIWYTFTLHTYVRVYVSISRSYGRGCGAALFPRLSQSRGDTGRHLQDPPSHLRGRGEEPWEGVARPGEGLHGTPLGPVSPPRRPARPTGTAPEQGRGCPALSCTPPPQVCLFFQNQLFRGNRATKVDTRRFAAFCSPHLPPLATVGADVTSERAGSCSGDCAGLLGGRSRRGSALGCGEAGGGVGGAAQSGEAPAGNPGSEPGGRPGRGRVRAISLLCLSPATWPRSPSVTVSGSATRLGLLGTWFW